MPLFVVPNRPTVMGPMLTCVWANDQWEELNSRLVTECGIKCTELPAGRYVQYSGEPEYGITCPACGPGWRPLGTPISQLSGRPGEPGYEEFTRIARSWGYD